MKILNPQSATLSNYEVFAHLTARREASMITAAPSTENKRQTRGRPPQQQRKLKAPNYEAISREILEYFAPGSTSGLPLPHTVPVAAESSTTATATATATTETSPSAAAGTNATTSQTAHPLPSYADKSTYSAARIASLLRDLAPFDLAKAELLMIVNLRPTDAASLDAVVEEVDERFDPGAQERILEVVKRWIGG